MSQEVPGSPPRSFYVTTGLAVAWNLVGVAVYVMQVTMSEEALAAMDPLQRAFMETTPTWLTGVFALAVNAGALGSLLLIFRKAWAIPVLILSLACIVVQMAYSNFMTAAIEIFGPGAAAQSAVVTAIGIYLVWYSRGAKDKGWIS